MNSDCEQGPRYVRITKVTEHTGLGRSKVYKLISEQRLRAVKADGCTLVEWESLLEYLGSLKPVVLRPTKRTVFVANRPAAAQGA